MEKDAGRPKEEIVARIRWNGRWVGGWVGGLCGLSSIHPVYLCFTHPPTHPPISHLQPATSRQKTWGAAATSSTHPPTHPNASSQ